MRIGILGGTFDPPHIGHLILADEAADQLKLDRLLWVLTPEPPHKLGQAISPVEQRLDLLEAALSGNDGFEISLVELSRPGPHYSLDTVRTLQEKMPGNDWVFLIGEDSLRDLPTWHEPQQLVQLVTCLGVMRRPEVTVDPKALNRAVPGVFERVQYYQAPLIDISSSDIRRRICHRSPLPLPCARARFRTNP